MQIKLQMLLWLVRCKISMYTTYVRSVKEKSDILLSNQPNQSKLSVQIFLEIDLLLTSKFFKWVGIPVHFPVYLAVARAVTI